MKWDVILPILIYTFITFIVGLYFNKSLKRRKKSFQEEFFVGGRNLGPIVLTFTLLASIVSAGTFIATPGLAYEIGFSWSITGFTQIAFGATLLGVLGKKFAIVSRRIDAVTITDFLRERFHSPSIVVGGSIATIFFLGAYMIAQFAGGARILEAITGLNYQVGVLIFGVSVVLYTAVGGFRAVSVTDAIQGIVMIIGGIILWIMFMVKTGGFTELVQELIVTNPEMVTLPGAGDMTPRLLFSYFIMFGIAMIGLPHGAVRGMAYKDSRTLHRSIVYSGIIMGLFTVFFSILGPVIRPLYPNIEIGDLALPTLILGIMPGWLGGLVLAAPIAATMSTVDSMLLSTSSSIVKDLYLNYINPKASDQFITKLSYIVTLLFGIIVVLLTLIPQTLIQFIIIYAIGGLASTFFAPIVFGLYWKGANKWGGITSMYIGLFSYLVIEQFFPEPFGMHTIMFSLTLSILSMIAVSLVTPKPSYETINKFWGKA